MSDLGAPGTTTVTCPRCGAQADAASAHCDRCGAALKGSSDGADAEELELVEAERAVAAAGFDADVELKDGRGRCPICGALNDLSGLAGTGRRARDTPSDRQDLEVLGFHCGNCGTALRAVVDHDDTSGGPGDGRDGTRPQHTIAQHTIGGRPNSYTHDRPVSHASFEDEVDRFEPSGPGSLRDHGDLIDEDGDDIRMYTGEPVETDEGWVVPAQQNFAGRDNIAGGGEWPDAHAAPAQPAPGSDRPEEHAGAQEREQVVTPAEATDGDAADQDLPARGRT